MLSCVCPTCGKKLKARAELAGKKLKCPGCGKPVLAPNDAPAPTHGTPSPDVCEEKTLLPSLATDTHSAADVCDEKTVLPRTVDEELPAPSLAGDPMKRSDRKPGPTETQVASKKPETDDAPDEPDPALWDFLAPPEQDDEIGRLGPYRVLKVLGAGGMGVVFKAEDPQLERVVALKAMLPSVAGSDSAKKRFLREARAAAALKHDNIVSIYQVGEDRGAPYLAMEFLHGEPLDARLKRDPKLPIPEILRIGRQVAEGLAAAHDHGLVHRDIKPANVWLETRGVGQAFQPDAARKNQAGKPDARKSQAGKPDLPTRAKILDFGLARTAVDQTQLTQSGAIVGTPAYMAPEQACGQKVDHRCDLFSLGCMLYRMCTGQLPFHGDTTIAILSALALETPKEPRTLNSKVPAGLNDLVMHLLAKKPDDRPESAQAVADALSALEAGDKPDVPRYRDKAKRKKLILAGGVALAALALLAVGFLTYKAFFTGAAPADGQPIASKMIKTPNVDQTDMQNALDALRREDVPIEDLTAAGGGDPKYAPEELVAVLGSTRLRFAKEVYCVAFTPDGARFAVGGGDGVVKMYNASTASELPLKFLGHRFVFSTDGKRLLTTMKNETAKIWDVQSGKELLTINAEKAGNISAVAFSLDGKRVATGHPKTSLFKVWDAFSGQHLATFEGHVLEDPTHDEGRIWESGRVAFLPDGKRMVSTGWKSIKVWDSNTGKEIPFSPPQLKPGEFPIQLAISADGERIASWRHCDSQRAQIWHSSNGKILLTLQNSPEFRQLNFSPDGKFVITCEGNDVVVYDSYTGQQLHKFQGHAGPVMYAIMNKDSTRVASASVDERTAKVWDLASGKEVFPHGHLRGVDAVAFHANNKQLISVSPGDGNLKLWDLSTRTETATASDPKGYYLCSVDPKWVFVSDSVFDWEKKETVISSLGHSTGGSWELGARRLSPDKKWFLSSGTDGTAKIWDAKVGQEVLTFKEHTQKSRVRANLSADGELVASGANDGRLKLWQRATGKVIHDLTFASGDRDLLPFFDADGKRLGCYTGSEVKIWDVVSGKELIHFKHSANIHNATFSPDGKRVASCGEDKMVRLWDPVTGKQEHFYLLGHVKTVNSVAFSRDGRYLATGNEDGTIYILRLPPLPGTQPTSTQALSP